MMVTANGVDTHPVHRGVWLLENILGDPPPSPPGDIPAIAPDTMGATTMREQLEAHRADASCARCHNKIDPLGTVLESFDPVGRWRDHYPLYTSAKDGEKKLNKEFYSTIGEGTRRGPKVVTSSVLSDGTKVRDASELKQYVLQNMDAFVECLAGKLLVYATGRRPSYCDRRLAKELAKEAVAKDWGFRDLLIAVIRSESFQSK